MSTMFNPREIPDHWTVADLISTSALGQIPFSELKERLGQRAFTDAKLVREALKHRYAMECGGRRKAIKSDGEALHALLALRDYLGEASHLMNVPLSMAVNLVIDMFRTDGSGPELASAVREATQAFRRFLGPDDFANAIEPMANVLAETPGAKVPETGSLPPLPDGIAPCTENEFTESFRERIAEVMQSIPGVNPQPGEAAKQLIALLDYLDAYIVLCIHEEACCPTGKLLGVTMNPVLDMARRISFSFYEFMYGMHGEDVYEDDFLPW